MKKLVTGRLILGMDLKKKEPFQDLEKDMHLKIYSINGIEKIMDVSFYTFGLAKKHELHKIGDYGIVFVYRKDDEKTIGSDIVMYNGKIRNTLGVEYPKMVTLAIENSNPVKRDVSLDINALEIAVLSAEEKHRKSCKIVKTVFEEFPDISDVLAKE